MGGISCRQTLMAYNGAFLQAPQVEQALKMIFTGLWALRALFAMTGQKSPKIMDQLQDSPID